MHEQKLEGEKSN